MLFFSLFPPDFSSCRGCTPWPGHLCQCPSPTFGTSLSKSVPWVDSCRWGPEVKSVRDRQSNVDRMKLWRRRSWKWASSIEFCWSRRIFSKLRFDRSWRMKWCADARSRCSPKLACCRSCSCFWSPLSRAQTAIPWKADYCCRYCPLLLYKYLEST